MNRRGLIVLALVLAIGLVGCAGQPDAQSESPTDQPLPVSSEPTAALAGAWVPDPRLVSAGILSLSIGEDGAVIESLTTTMSATDDQYDGQAKGAWQSSADGEVLFTQEGGLSRDGSTATYRFTRTGDTLTLTWISGAPSQTRSHGPVSFPTAEGDAWVTGTHDPVEFTLKD